MIKSQTIVPPQRANVRGRGNGKAGFPMRDDNTTRTIPLTRGFFALVDEEDYSFLSQHSWHANPARVGWYAARTANGTTVYMHRAIVKPESGEHIDHRNRNGLDNRRCNLRVATLRQNLANSRPRNGCGSRYKGVSWHKQDGLWRAYIAGKHIGLFRDEVAAALAYDVAALDRWGEFARPNFLR